MTERWNPRYLAWCRAIGMEPGAKDRPMWEFMAWIQDRWREWERINGRKPHGGLDVADHEAFDAWLASREESA